MPLGVASREKCVGKNSNRNHWDLLDKNFGLWRIKTLYFQEGNKLNFQSGLGMEDPSLNKINRQPDLQLMELPLVGKGAGAGKDLVVQDLLRWEGKNKRKCFFNPSSALLIHRLNVW